ncbi:uncharacterized protein L199_006897 [Kwoniella botswanensis]|uniref:uncharacterized protein n=1 Tax=Kwoniella botswanensis TaxID=1268659 RepID=UPI00315CC39E
MGLAEVNDPNYRVMFMPDQLRYDSLGCTGNPIIKTPHFDALAKEGTLFTNCFAQASVCTQSRCSMFTGQYLHTSAHRSLDYMLKPWEGNLFKSLKKAGYHVCSISPRGDLCSPGVTEQSFSEYGWIEDPPNWPPKFINNRSDAGANATLNDRLFYKGMLTEAESEDFDEMTIRSALQWLKSNPPEPFVLFLPLIYPHPPFQVKDPYYSLYRELSLPLRVRAQDKTGYEPKYLGVMRKEHGLDRASEEDWHEIKAVYYGMINRLDDQLGSIINVLKSSEHGNLWDRTYTLMFTDHGEYLGDSDMVEKWPSGLHEVLVRDPLMIVGPDLPSDQVNEAMCEMIDLTPTVLELLGVKENYPHSGKSLVKTIKENAQEHKPYAFSEGGFLLREEPLLEYASFPYDRKAEVQHTMTEVVGRAVSVRDKEWAYTYRLYEPAELFNRREDPGEAHNLAALPEYAQICLRFERAIMKWMVETSDYVPFEIDPRFPSVDLEPTKDQVARHSGLDQDGIVG